MEHGLRCSFWTWYVIAKPNIAIQIVHLSWRVLCHVTRTKPQTRSLQLGSYPCLFVCVRVYVYPQIGTIAYATFPPRKTALKWVRPRKQTELSMNKSYQMFFFSYYMECVTSLTNTENAKL